MHKNALVIQRGRCVAVKVAGRIEFLAEIDPGQQFAIRKSLQIGRRVHPAADAAVPPPHLVASGASSRRPDETRLNSRRRMGW
jgi:hypothetical protein